jgi:hypothetical protein
MRITIEAVDIDEVEKIIFLLKSLDIKKVELISGKSEHGPSITKGNKKINPRALFGIRVSGRRVAGRTP